MKRLLVPILFLVFLIGIGRYPDALADENEPLEVYFFAGQVVNKFSSSAMLELLNPEEKTEEVKVSIMGGLEFNYDIAKWHKDDDDYDRAELRLFGQFIHTLRSAEIPCDTCESGTSTSSTPGSANMFHLLKDSDAIEWLLGMQLIFAKWNKGDKPCDKYQTGIYLKGQFGFIRIEEAGDDVIDNFFWGIGIEQLDGNFEGSFLEVGGGKSDIFDPSHRWARLKVAAVLEFTPIDKQGNKRNYSYFIEGWFDSDAGPASDDIQIYFGLSCNIVAILGG